MQGQCPEYGSNGHVQGTGYTGWGRGDKSCQQSVLPVNESGIVAGAVGTKKRRLRVVRRLGCGVCFLSL